MLKTPDFWRYDSTISKLLSPLGAVYDGLGVLRRVVRQKHKVAVPVVCVGNAVVGGSGKTPVTLAIGEYLKSKGKNVHFLCYGYKGDLTQHNAVKVEPHYTYHDVGDEAKMLAKVAPTWAGKDRYQAAQLAIKNGAEVLVMDDGFQYPKLYRDVLLLVVDGGFGVGNGRVFPAGPLRENFERAIGRCDHVLLVGEDRTGLESSLAQKPLTKVDIQPKVKSLKGKKVVAFAGIGRPEKFFNTLNRLGAEVVETHAFADHHFYTNDELRLILDHAKKQEAEVYTTTKDAVKITPDILRKMTVLDIEPVFESADSLDKILKPVL